MVLIGRRQLQSNNSWMHNIAALNKGRNRCTLLVGPADAERLGLADGSPATITSGSGTATVPVEITDTMMSGVVSLPHGWGHDDPPPGSESPQDPGTDANSLTPATVDPRPETPCSTRFPWRSPPPERPTGIVKAGGNPAD